MPYKSKEKKGKWIGKVTRNGYRRRKLFETKAEASSWEKDQKALPFDEFLSETPMTYSLAEWAEAYLDHAKAKFSKKSYQEKRIAFREFFKSMRPALEPSKLHAGMLLRHFDGQAQARSGNAANKDRKNLIAAWNWAIKYLPGWPEKNPVAVTDKQKSKQFPRYIPPVEDYWKVFDMAGQGQDKTMLLTYLHTGARRGEIFELTWDDVDFEGKRIRLWTQKRKGGREFDWVPMTSELQVVLTSWCENRTFLQSPYVFLCEEKNSYCIENYGKPFHVRQHWLPKLCEKAGVKPFGFHAIRHLAASILDDAGYPITIIQALLRHKNANTTARYLHRLRGMRETLDEAFKRKSRLVEDEPSRRRPILRLVKM